LKKETAQISSGGGLVKVIVNGNQEIVKVEIAPELINMKDKSLLEDLILSAVNEAKKKAQEIAQEKVNVTPHYEVLSEEGPDHDKCFLVGVFLANKKIAEGRGKSKQKAEQESAINALKKWSA